MNILTFDLEEWYLERILFGGREFKFRQYNESFDKLLDDLDRLNIKATMFCVGKLVDEFPEVIKKIAARGHEVGCHGNKHEWLTKMNEATLRMDTMEAIKALEDNSGQKVVSYRSPAFSITEKNQWAFEVLAECGIENDSSIFPATRDYGGYPTFPGKEPCLVKVNGTTIKEFPITLTSIMGKSIAYSGGGFFRVLPFPYVKRTMEKKDYNVCYFHLNDLVDHRFKLKSRKEYEDYFHEPGTLKNRLVRYVKSNIGNGDTYSKLLRLLEDERFVGLREADQAIDWDKTDIIDLNYA